MGLRATDGVTGNRDHKKRPLGVEVGISKAPSGGPTRWSAECNWYRPSGRKKPPGPEVAG
jgi:hypothetical protein